MTLESTINKNRYIGNGATTQFPFTFKVWKTDQVLVFVGNGEREYEVSSQCSIEITASGGVVTFTTAPIAGVIIVIRRGMPYIQEDDYRNGTRFDAEEVEDRFDQDCAERQDLRLDIGRAIKIPETADKPADEFVQDFFNAVETAENAAASAEASKNTAGEYAASALSSKNAAENSVNSAAASATSAAGSANAAATSAQLAAIDAQDARDAAHFANNNSLANFILEYSNNESLELAWQNNTSIEQFVAWRLNGVESIRRAGREALLVKEAVGDLISAYDESAAQRRLMNRLFDGTNPGASSKPVLFVISGQSNAVGYGAYTPFDRAVDCGWYWSWADGAGELKPLVDPIGNALTLGSGWCAFARRFVALTGRKVILLNIASGGSVVTDGGYTTWNTWADNGYGTLRSSRQTIWDAFSAAVPATDYELGGILWDQGGTDGDRIYAGTITVQDFKDGTLDVWAWHRTMVGSATCPIFAALIDYNYSCLTNAGVKAARKAIMDATYDICINGGDSNVHLGFTIAPDYIHAWDYYMSDSVHYNPHGYRVQGDSFARSAAHYLGL